MDWSGAKRYRHCCQQTEKTSRCLYSLISRHFKHFYCTVDYCKIDTIDELLAKVTKM